MVVAMSLTRDLTWGNGQTVDLIYYEVRTSGRVKRCLEW